MSSPPANREEGSLEHAALTSPDVDEGLLSDRDAFVISDQPSPAGGTTPVLEPDVDETIEDEDDDLETENKKQPKGFILEFDASDFKKPIRKKKQLKKKSVSTNETPRTGPSPAPSTPPMSGLSKKRSNLTSIDSANQNAVTSTNSVEGEGAKVSKGPRKSFDDIAMEAAAQRLVDRQRGVSAPAVSAEAEGESAMIPNAGPNRRREYQRIAADHDPSWTYQPPPNNQRTLLFAEEWPPPSWALAGGRSGTSATQRSAEDPNFPLVYDNKFIVLGFSSDFDSGNLIQVERTAPYTYNLHCCPDCGNSPFQTNNKQWFHFSVRGLPKGIGLKCTMVGLANSKMYTFGWVPVNATVPLTAEARAAILKAHAANSTKGALGTMLGPGSPILHSRLLAACEEANDPAAQLAVLAKKRGRDGSYQTPFSEDTYMSAMAAGEAPILYSRMTVREAKAVVTVVNEPNVVPGYPSLAYKPIVNKFASPGAPDAIAPASTPPPSHTLQRQLDQTDVTGEGGSIYLTESFDSATAKIADHISKSRGVTIIPLSPIPNTESPLLGTTAAVSVDKAETLESKDDETTPEGATLVLDDRQANGSPVLVAVTENDREQLSAASLLNQKSSLVIGDRLAFPAAKNTEKLQPNALPSADGDDDGNESETLGPEGGEDGDDGPTERVRIGAKASLGTNKDKIPSSYNISFDVATEVDIPFVPTTETERCALAIVIKRFYTPSTPVAGSSSSMTTSGGLGLQKPMVSTDFQTSSSAASTIAAAKSRPISPFPQGHPKCPALFVAGNHPYSFGRLCRHLLQWNAGVLKYNDELAISGGQNEEDGAGDGAASAETGETVSRLSTPPPASVVLCPTTGKSISPGGIYYNEEVLCTSLDGHDVHLLTITGIGPKTKTGPREDIISEISSPVIGSSLPNVPCRGTRPLTFPNKKYIVISARIHPGETPASYMLHGAMDFILHPSDPRAARLRRDCVIVVVPIINPDGTHRGHSRADTTGQNLNRCYRDPSFSKHPSPFAVRNLLMYLQNRGRLHLYVDLHAHANKKGTFAYGNSMESVSMVQNLLYAKLVAMNSPYFEFPSCNFSENNMFAVGKTGEGKDCSSRVTIYQDTGFVHSYTVEANYVAASSINAVIGLPNLPSQTHTTTYTMGQLFVPPSALLSAAASALSPAAAQVAAYLSTQPTASPSTGSVFTIGSNIPISEQADVPPTGAAVPTRYSPSTHADVGRGLLLGFMDLHNMQPEGFSRVAKSTFKTTKAVGQAISKYLMIDVVEAMRRQVMYRCGISHKEFFNALKVASSGGRTPSLGRLSLLPTDLPTSYTAKGSRTFPPTTIYSLGNIAAKYASGGNGAGDVDTILWTTFASATGGEHTLSHGFVSDPSSSKEGGANTAAPSLASSAALGRKGSAASLNSASASFVGGSNSRAPSGSNASAKVGHVAGRRKSSSAPSTSSNNEAASVCVVGTALPKPAGSIPNTSTAKGRSSASPAPLPKSSSRSPSLSGGRKTIDTVPPTKVGVSEAAMGEDAPPQGEGKGEELTPNPPSSANATKKKKVPVKSSSTASSIPPPTCLRRANSDVGASAAESTKQPTATKSTSAKK